MHHEPTIGTKNKEIHCEFHDFSGSQRVNYPIYSKVRTVNNPVTISCTRLYECNPYRKDLMKKSDGDGNRTLLYSAYTDDLPRWLLFARKNTNASFHDSPAATNNEPGSKRTPTLNTCIVLRTL